MPWVVEALEQLGGSGSVVEVSRVVWARHRDELEVHGDLFYTWQYDIRWAGQKLRDDGTLEAVAGRRNSEWRLTATSSGRDEADRWAMGEAHDDV